MGTNVSLRRSESSVVGLVNCLMKINLCSKELLAEYKQKLFYEKKSQLPLPPSLVRAMSIKNITRIMAAVQHHYKLMNGGCACSVCAEVRRPDVCPDLEELLSYNRSAAKKPIEVKKDAPMSASERPYTPPRPPEVPWTGQICETNTCRSSCERDIEKERQKYPSGSRFWE